VEESRCSGEPFVTTDANGNLAATSFSPQSINQLSANVSALQQNLQHGLNQAFEGTAIAIAMGGSALPDNKRFRNHHQLGQLPRHQRHEPHRPGAHQRRRGGECWICQRISVWRFRLTGRRDLGVVGGHHI